MAFLKICQWCVLTVSVTLAITMDEEPLTVTCQNIRHDKILGDLDSGEGSNMSLESCTIITQSSYSSDSIHEMCCQHCHSCSLPGTEEGQWKGKTVSRTVKLNSTKLYERKKRQEGAERPLHTSGTERVLQAGHTYHLPCPVFSPGDVINDIVWFKGSNCDPKKRQKILQHYNPPDGTLITPSPHYQFTETNYGLVIESANLTDSDRYWCKAHKEPIGEYVEEFLDLIVLGTNFPMHRWPDTVEDIAKITLNFEEAKLVTCPVMSQTSSRRDDVTVYWSRLNTEDGQSMEIVFPDVVGVVAGGEYRIDGDNNLVVDKFNEREEMYCCHVFQEDTDPRQGCVRVVWGATQKPKYPVISACVDVKTPEGQCDVRLESDQDFFQLDCLVNNVYPRPDVSWSLKDCIGTNATGFSTCNDWTYDNVSMTYSAISKLYLHNLPLESFSCNFICTSLGGAIQNGGESSSVKISRAEEIKSSCNYALLFIMTSIFVTVLIILVIRLCLAFPRSRGFIMKHVSDMGTFSCLVDDEETPTRSKELKLTELTHLESSPMIVKGSEGDANTKEPVCLISRTNHNIIFTDNTYNWVSLGELVTNSSNRVDTKSGFKYILHVIPSPIQDGGLVIIDSVAMHQFTSEYHYKYVNLYKQVPANYLCVTYSTTNKLIFGLKMGKLKIFDPDKAELSTFASVLPVGQAEVKLDDISVDCNGFVFAADSKGKAISMFDPEGVYINRVEINIVPKFIFAHTTEEMKVDIFVSSESKVEMYGCDRKPHYPYRATMGAPKYIVDDKMADAESFCSGGITVRDDNLFLLNRLTDDKNVQVLQRKQTGGDEEHKFIVAVSDEDEADTVTSSGIKGIAFAKRGEMVFVYFDNAVYIFEKTKKDSAEHKIDETAAI
ncbi:uncharacterized protein [Asterias amurensis]|uniref:uncharacterized protein isoform X1 n=1 Tax=Asterias amurensis TaxID=7602 RepID=UPI003AB6CA95